ncbi:PREDICTED: sterile alpha motif domain-containing protein 7 [Hipposideros armiger]|uniref:Sterile alpha motif domain-containing protein 7 n=1 Tax=Hipposideros armiger TaxID=186990 RepID=A0A8B7REI1_HIPAR|nr:PREDICTED: sterile alpha motif domain-containing protein 7 [Hipposideros armiger]
MEPTESRRHVSMPGKPGSPEERHLWRLSSGMTLEELHQWREVLMINPIMAVNPLLTASGQQRIPLVPSSFEPPTVDRYFSPTCWGILPPESIKAVARRNEMIRRQHTARMEMEMHAIYQQRRIEKVNPKGLAGLGLPLLYGPSISAGPASCHSRSMRPASELHLHRHSLRNVQGNPMLVAPSPRFLESWGQKYRRLRRGAGNQKVLDSDAESPQSQAEEKTISQTHAIPSEEEEYVKDPETETLNNQKSSETKEKPATALANTCGEMELTHQQPWGVVHGAPLETKAWDRGKEMASEQAFAACGEKNGLYPPVPQPSLPGTHALITTGGNLPLDEDIQKWTVSDVHNFISGLPGCSGYAQVFKDHAIDGETLPLLTEEHLRSTMGLKLGPALKIQSQVSQHVERMFYKKNFSLPAHTKQAFDQPADTSPLLDFNSWGDTLNSPYSQDVIIPKGIERDSVRN